jgi:hypothetical protein
MPIEQDGSAVGPAEAFRAKKAAQIDRVNALLRKIVTRSPKSADDANGIVAVVNELNEMVEQTMKVKADMISAAINSRATAQSQPGICSTCVRLMTESETDLAEYIDLVAQQASQMGWPADLCRAKLRTAMKPGDRLSLLGYGRAQIVRPDGSSFVVYQRDS